ncbi:uncharacterized protein LOC126212666 [Schistocerca nitens]|uniref:uncharacterized protein LOC126212666 n=1 Tax=Schistocerca nitens TaxID=7011 RepID=UPI0021176FF8|nr:uncharacterized protein LOC126212666 [Schistocerca nitens]
MNGKCPAEMKVTVHESGTYQVHFVSTHIGHKQDLTHLPLSQKDRETIATDIAMGLPYDKVLDNVRTSLQDSDLQRIHLTTKQDLYNIAASYNLSSKSVRHKNDAISVEAWVKEMNESENPSVLFYKPQDSTSEHQELRSEDFVLVIMNRAQREMLSKYGEDCICIDGTHGLNGYDFEVTTLLVLDDLRQGFPCAFLISNRKDADVLSIFLQYVKSQVGPICPNVFMSDLAESYSIAWNRTMGAPKMRLYSTWHVDRAWKTNIKRKISDLDKRNEVYRLIKSVSMLRNVSMFQESLQKALQKLSSDPDTSEFASYFKTHYEGNVECWAYCHRMYAGLNTNMHVESMHRTLKEIHGNARQIKRLDKGISTLMSLVTAKMFDWLIANVKGKVTSKVQDIRNKHKTSLLMDKDLITEVDGGWEVPSTSSSEVYIVKDNRVNCECKLKCSDCNVCIHRYYCTCMDYSIRFNMCKHIHTVCRDDSVGENPLQSLELLGTDVDATSERAAILAEVSTKYVSKTPKSLLEGRQKLISEFSNIVSGMSETELQLAKKTVLSLKANVGAVRARNSYFKQTDKGQKRKLIPQQRLFSTKKKTARNISLAVPNAEERCEVVKSLLNEGMYQFSSY